ncbi:MAG: hypothetical protein Alpg2KO_03240 [Alphaproteobacteria bacterium]
MKVVTRNLPLFAALCALPLLAACETTGGAEEKASVELPPQSCPEVLFVREARVLVRFDGRGTSEQNIRTKAGMTGYVGECVYEDNHVEVTLDSQWKVERGAAMRGDEVGLPYFVAIMDPDRETILARKSMRADIEFDDDDVDVIQHIEKLRHRIPIDSVADGEAHQIILGFELTEEEQAFNERAIAESRTARP